MPVGVMVYGSMGVWVKWVAVDVGVGVQVNVGNGGLCVDVWTWRGVAAWCECLVEGACVLVAVNADVNGVVPVEVDDWMTSSKKSNPRLQFGRISGEVGREVDVVDVVDKVCVDVDVDVDVIVDYGVDVCMGIVGDDSDVEGELISKSPHLLMFFFLFAHFTVTLSFTLALLFEFVV